MTRIMTRTCKCSVCRYKSEYRVLSSTNSFGYPDLDGRPPGMARSTMYLWIQECPKCGYANSSIEDKVSRIIKKYVKSDEYLNCNGFSFKSGLAKSFYKLYLMSQKENNVEKAFNAALHAAWASDDVGDNEIAKVCRKHAVDLVDIINVGGKIEGLKLTKADLLRRMGNFEKVIEEYEGMKSEDEFLQKAFQFEVELAKLERTGVYTSNDVMTDNYEEKKELDYDEIMQMKESILVDFIKDPNDF